MKKLVIAVLALSLALSAQTPALPTEQTVNDFFQHMFGYDPAVKWKITRIAMSPGGLPEVWVLLSNPQGEQTTRLYIMPDGRHALQGEMLPFGSDPFAPARALLAQANGPARGPAGAPLNVVVFSDLQCPHCKQAEPILDKLQADNPNTRIVFQHFPLPNHDWAFKAASWADCIGRDNIPAFWKFVDATFAAQETITAGNADQKLAEVAGAAGADAARSAACAAAPDTRARVEGSLKLGQQLGVTGTPTVYLNGRKISGINTLPYEILNRLAKFQATLPK